MKLLIVIAFVILAIPSQTFGKNSRITLLNSFKISAKKIKNYKYKVKDGVEYHLYVETKDKNKKKFTLSPKVTLTGVNFNYQKISKSSLKEYLYDPDITILSVDKYVEEYRPSRKIIQKSHGLILIVEIYGEIIPKNVKELKSMIKIGWDPQESLDQYSFNLIL